MDRCKAGPLIWIKRTPNARNRQSDLSRGDYTVIGMLTLLSALGSLLSFRVRSRALLELELIALRHQLTVLGRQRLAG